MDKGCSILILSCDANIDVLKVFLKKYKEYMSEVAMDTYICLEEKDINVKGINILFSQEKYWSKRIKDYLNQIKSKYVIFILDDFIIEEKVQVENLYQYIGLMEKNNNIARITLNNLQDKKAIKSQYANLNVQNKFSNYLVNMQISIWDKNLFYSLLKEKESPWQTELYGSIRARKMQDKSFLYISDDSLLPIKYNKGWLVVRGKWNSNELDRLHLHDEYAQDFFLSRGVEKIDYKITEKSQFFRIKRRLFITLRQILSYFKIYT